MNMIPPASGEERMEAFLLPLIFQKANGYTGISCPLEIPYASWRLWIYGMRLSIECDMQSSSMSNMTY